MKHGPYPYVRRDLTEIAYTVAEHFGISPSELLAGSKRKTTSEARTIAYALCRDLTEASATEVSDVFGKHHMTVLTMVKRLAARMKREPQLARSVSVCRARALEAVRARRIVP